MAPKEPPDAPAPEDDHEEEEDQEEEEEVSGAASDAGNAEPESGEPASAAAPAAEAEGEAAGEGEAGGDADSDTDPDAEEKFTKDGGDHDISKGSFEVKRGCTDCLWFLALCFGVFTFVGVDMKAFKEGDPRVLVHGKDYEGKVCGVSEGVEDYPLLYWPTIKAPPDPIPSHLTHQTYEGITAWRLKGQRGICTDSCPTSYSAVPRGKCPPKDKEACTWYARKSQKVLGRYCMFKTDDVQVSARGDACTLPNATKTAMTSLEKSTASEFAGLRDQTKDPATAAAVKKARTNILAQQKATSEEIEIAFKEQGQVGGDDDKPCKDLDRESWTEEAMADLENSKVLVLAVVPAVATIMGMLFLGILRCCGKCVVWMLLWGLVCALIITALVMDYLRARYAEEGMTRYAQAAQGAQLIFGLATLVMLTLMTMYRKQISLAVTVGQIAGQAIMQCPSTLLLPILSIMCTVAWTAYILYALCHVFAAGLIIGPADNALEERWRYKMTDGLKINLLIHLVAWFFGKFFISGVCTTALSCAACAWYYCPMKKDEESGQDTNVKDLPSCIACRSLLIVIRYHLGSVAIGAALIAIIQTLCFIIGLFERQLKEVERTKDGLRCCMKIAGCMIYMLETCMKMLSRKAYIMVGVTGKSFCASASSVWGLMNRHPARFILLQGLGWLVEWVCTVWVIFGTVVATHLIIENTDKWRDGLRSNFYVLVFSGVLAGFIGAIMASLVGTTADAIFFCFVIEEEMGDFQFAPQAMRSFADASTTKDAGKEAEDEPDPNHKKKRKRRGCCGCC